MTKKNKKKKTASFSMQFVTSSISTTMVLLLLGLVVFFVLVAHNLSVYVRENITLSVLVSDDIQESDILKMKQNLDTAPFAKHISYISKNDALNEERKEMGTDPSEFLGYNPFTASLEIDLRSDYANSDSIAKIEKTLRTKTGVKDVLYHKELTDLVNQNIRNISIVLLSLAVVLTLISFALINNTIRLTIYSKRFLIHTMKLVGANWNFIRKPFLRVMIWSGVIAALIADALLMAGACSIVNYQPELAGVITPQVMLIVAAAVLAFGILITYSCAYLSLNRYLRMKASALYYI